jgi:hypothetical protein
MDNRAREIYKPEFHFGLGGVSLGNEFNKHTDKDAEATLEAAWAVGVRYYDVAPWYGFGLRLHAWGVRRIYGYPGDGINGVIGALQRADKIDFVQVRHEEMAAFMAVAHAKFTGEIGVCLSTGGPGATHLLTGLYDAKLDHAPVLAICGQAEATVRGANYQQELNLDRMFSDAALFVQEASAPAQVRHLRQRILRQLVCPRLSGEAGSSRHRSRAAWRRWARPCHTPSASSSPIPTDR